MITFIGAGNVAWQLAQAFEKVGGCMIDTIYSRSSESASQLAVHLYDCSTTTELDFRQSKSKFFILAIPDDAILGIAKKLMLPQNAILLHTSGTLGLEELQKTMIINHSSMVKCGVFYPLMTFTKGKKIEIKNIPFCIEATTEDTENEVIRLAKKLSENVRLVTSKERRVLHVAAVFACNFTNHLWAISQKITDTNNLEFDLLKPLIKETFVKAMESETSIMDAQTGPAQRHDQKTIMSHLAFLEENSNLKKIYLLLTTSIQEKFS